MFGKEFSQAMRMEIETGFGLRFRHDLKSEDGQTRRGWKGLAVMDAKMEKVENRSEGSES